MSGLTVAIVLIAPDAPRIYAAGGALPTVTGSRTDWWEVTELVAAATTTLGLPVRALACLTPQDDREKAGFRAYALEPTVDRAPTLAGAWVDATALDAGAMPADAFARLQAALAARADPTNRLAFAEPWTGPQWLGRAQAFVSGALPGAVAWTQLRAWPRSCVYQLASGPHRYYLKALPPAYAIEASLTHHLANAHAVVPTVLASDAAHGLLLSAEAVGAAATSRDVTMLCAAVDGLARLQLAESEELERLATMAVPRHDFAALTRSLEALVSGTDVPGLADAAPRLRAALAELAALGLPLSVEHGDFRAANVIGDDRGVRIIDWGCAAVAPPFFSVAQLLDEEPLTASARAQISAAYLAPWRARWPSIAVGRALELARLLMPLARAAERRERLLPSLADPRGWEGATAYWLRRCLARLTG